MLKDFFEKLNEDSNDKAKVMAEQNVKNNYLLDFYMNDQVTPFTNILEFCEDVGLNTFPDTAQINLESIEEEEEDVEEFESGYKESLCQLEMETITVNDDSHDDPHHFIKVAIREMFPIHSYVLDTKYGSKENNEPNYDFENDSASEEHGNDDITIATEDHLDIKQKQRK